MADEQSRSPISFRITILHHPKGCLTEHHLQVLYPQQRTDRRLNLGRLLTLCRINSNISTILWSNIV